MVYDSVSLQSLNTLLAGGAIVFGILSLTLGKIQQLSRSFKYFGLISMFAGIYYLLIGLFSNVYYSVGHVQESYGNVLMYIALCSYMTSFGFFPFFVSSYTGYSNLFLKRAIILSMSLSIVLMLSFGFTDGIQVWNIIAHVSALCIIAYGVLAALHMRRYSNKRSGNIILTLFIVFGVLVIEDVVHVHLPQYYPIDLPNGVMPLDYYLLFFIALMGSEICGVFKRSIEMENKLIRQKHQLNDVVENISLLTIRICPDGKLCSVNPFFTKVSGFVYSDLQHDNWFKLLVPEKELDERKQIFKGLNPESRNRTYKGTLLTKNKKQKKILWTIVAQYTNNLLYDGVIGFGLDITEREIAYDEIERLKNKLELENRSLKKEIKRFVGNDEMICDSPAGIYAFEKAIEVARTNSIVLLEGETGVGKEVFAKLIHQESDRREMPFVAVNCSAFPKDLIDSELFGHEKGAYTGASKLRRGKFEIASGGTLFLDEIGELPLDVQPKLLRVLQDGSFERIGGEKSIVCDTRIIVATNRMLKQEVKLGSFRKDLFYRLNVYPITIPPLRKRLEDIPRLIEYYTDLYSRKYNKEITAISENTYQSFVEYEWPGNIRELKNLIERAVINCKSVTLKTNGLLEENKKALDDEKLRACLSMEEVETNHIREVLESVNWKVHGTNGAAQILQMNPSTLRSRMKKLHIEREPLESAVN